MPEEKVTEHPGASAQPGSPKAPSLTDAEANRQVGQGQAPHAADISQAVQGSEKFEQPAEETAPEGCQTVKVGARDVVRPSNEDDGSTGSEGSLTDRLAQKDNTNDGPGPSSVA